MDEDLAEASECACLLAIGLLNYADDEGYFNANPKLIKAAVFPLREPSVPITVMLRELSNHGYLSIFSTPDGKHFGLIKNFVKHQVVNKKKDSKIKQMELIPYQYGTDTVTVPVGMDQGSGNGKDKTPHIMREENLSPEGGEKTVLPDAAEPMGKFPMFSGWIPSLDFRSRAALGGIILTEDYQPTELASFVMYWQLEGKAFHQLQWEQKFARHIQQERSRVGKQKIRGPNEKPQSNTASGESVAVQQIRAERERWERERRGNSVDFVGDDGENLFQPLDHEEWQSPERPVDCSDWEHD